MYRCWENVPEDIRKQTAEFFSDGEVYDGWRVWNQSDDRLFYVCPFGYAFFKQDVTAYYTPPSSAIRMVLDKLEQHADIEDILDFLDNNDNGRIENYYEALGVPHEQS